MKLSWGAVRADPVGLNPLQEVGVMKLENTPASKALLRLNPLQEVGVMNRTGMTRYGRAFRLNPLQEVGVMKRIVGNAGTGKTVLIPFRKSG